MTTLNITDIIKFAIVIIVVILIYRLVKQNGNIGEGFTNNNIPEFYGNFVPHNKVSYSDGNNNIATIYLTNKVRLESLVLDLEVDESSTERTMALLHYTEIKNDTDLGNNMITDDQGNMEHQMIENSNGFMRIKIHDIKMANNDKPVTDVISVTLNGGEQFKVKNVWVYGMDQNAITRATLTSDLESLPASEKKSQTDPKTSDTEIYILPFTNPIRIHCVIFNTQLVDNYKPREPPKFEIHYKGVDDGNFKVDTPLYLTNLNMDKTQYVTQNVFLPNSVVAKEIYIKLPSSSITGISEERFIGKIIKTDSFSNTISNREKTEKFASSEYNSDDMCPSLDAMEDKIQLTDQICARLEYNDKIKNERIKLERSKQYISKLKEQDDEIKKLENVITSLQSKRDQRDNYDDALRLAQYDKQKKQASVIQDLAQKRDSLRNNNIVNVQLNLKNKPVTQVTQVPQPSN
jgi:hypothetical protein